MLASPLYLQEREASADRSLFPTKLSVQFISFPRKCRETCPGVLTQQKVESRHIFRQRGAFLLDIKRFKERVNFFSFSDPEEAARTVLEGQRDHQLAEAKSENVEARM